MEDLVTSRTVPGTIPDNVGPVVSSVSYTYGTSGWKDQLTAYGTDTISYDDIGNPLSDGTWSYTWAQGRQLQSMARSLDSYSLTFEYNEDGLRTKKTSSTGYVSEYTWHGTKLTHMKRNTTTMHFFYDAQGRPATLRYGSSTYGYLYNLQGDVIAIVDSTGAKVVEYTYDAWGKQLTCTGSKATTVGAYQPFRYRGYIYDFESGLYYLRSRYYNPVWGRFINADSLVKGNLYRYCGNNSIIRVDHNGYDYNEDSVFHNSVTPGMRRFLRRKNDYYYRIGSNGIAWKKKEKGSSGWIDCVYLLSEQFKGPSSSDRRYNPNPGQEEYFDKKGDICELVERIKSGEPIENFVYIEVFHWDGSYNHDGSFHMSHCGVIVIHNFTGENELAVLQSASQPISYCSALFADDTGPNLSALFDFEGGTGNWTYYGIKYDEKHHYQDY